MFVVKIALVEKQMKHFVYTVFFLLVPLIFFPYCNGDGNGNGPQPQPPQNPLPNLTALSPTSAVSHLPAFTLTVTGSDFVSGARIVFNGTEMSTTFVDSGELTCQIEPGDTLVTGASVYGGGPAAGPSNESVIVLVRNPAPGGGDSNSLDFTIHDNHTFGSPQNISQNAGFSYHPDIAVDKDGGINVVWYDDTPGNDEIFFSRSSDGGAAWTQAVNVSNNPGISFTPVVGVDDAGNLNAAWWDTSHTNREIFFSRSTDEGVTWSQPEDLTHNSGRSDEPAMAVGGSGTIYLVWEDKTPGNWDILFTRSRNGGASWSPLKNISKNPAHSSWPAIAVDGSGHINVAWNDYTTGSRRVFFSRSSDGGTTWSSAVNVYNQTGLSGYPAIAVDGDGYILLAWIFSTPSERRIYVSRSIDNGLTWSQPVSVAPQSQDGVFPDMAVDSVGNINLVWWDQGQGNREIYFSRSIDNGATWTQALNISDNAGDSVFPAVAVDRSGRVYVVWIDHSAGNREIFFSISQ
jgi:hypothetical protein